MSYRMGSDRKVNRISRVDFHAQPDLLDSDIKVLVTQVESLIFSLPDSMDRPKGLVIENATIGSGKEFENVEAYFWFDGYQGVKLTKVGVVVSIDDFEINKLNAQKSELEKSATQNQMPAEKRTLGWS